MTAPELLDAQCESLAAFYRLIADGEPRSRIVELGDVQACVVPASPVASIANGVVYRTADALTDALPELGAIYGELPYLVWVRPGDERAAAACLDHGLSPDGRPAFMAAALEEIEPPRGTVEATAATWAEVSAINERAYGLPPGSFAGVFTAVTAEPPARIYAASAGGVVVSVVLALEHEANLGIYLVATAPEAQRRGLAAELIRVAAAEARERGVRTTTLEATAMGRPVYAAIGYRELGVVEQYERRLRPRPTG